MISVNLDVSVDGFATWRDAARRLLMERRAPEQINWLDHSVAGAGSEQSLFGDSDSAPHASPFAARAVAVATPALPSRKPPEPLSRTSESAEKPPPRISAQVLELLRLAAMFNDRRRWALLYRILWRCQQGDHSAVSPADEDGARLNAMVKAIKREIHKMHAFVRFREWLSAPDDAPRFIAWYEPVHDVLQAASPHFQHRMGQIRWLIATPQGTALCDGQSLHFGPPAARPPDIENDSGEALWLQYYRSTFNPSRVNPRMMTQEMPVRYWKNLPEGKLIPGLLAHADGGARRVAQAVAVARRPGTQVAVSGEKAMPAREAAHSLDECRRCDLWQHATQAVPGSGPIDARIMIIGEQPGDAEDIQGKAFVGPAGQLLDRAFEQAGVARGSVYLTNAVKHFKWEPRGKRRIHKTPAQREMLACHEWLERELTEVDPSVLVVLGATAAKAVLGNQVAFAAVRGQTIEQDGRRVITTWHPSYVLRVPDADAKAAAFNDIVAALSSAASLSRQSRPGA